MEVGTDAFSPHVVILATLGDWIDVFPLFSLHFLVQSMCLSTECAAWRDDFLF